MNLSNRILLGCSLAACLGGCATPQVALDHANNTAALAVSLSQEVENLRSTQATIAKARLDSIERLNTSLAEFDADTRWRNDIQELAGNGERLQLMAKLKKAADSRATYEAELQATLAEQRKANAELLAPLPSQSASLGELAAKLGALGEELSHKERLDLVAAFAKTVKKSIEENRDKIDAAQEDAADAPVSALPSKPAND